MDAKKIFEREHGLIKTNQEVTTRQPHDEHVLIVEEKLTAIQEFATRWQRILTQNEKIVSVMCFFAGIVYSFAINQCTGDFNPPWYAYTLAASCVGLFSLLLIREGTLPLSVIVKFSMACVFGHIILMFLVALDSHYFKAFTINTCRYPFSGNDVMWWVFGAGCGYLFSKLSVGSVK